MNLAENFLIKSNEQLCLDRIEECFVIAETKFNIKIPRPPVVFTSHMTKCGGTARSFGGIPIKIKLSKKLLDLNGHEFIKEVPGHEAAHIIANFIHKERCKHDHRWKAVMRMIGQNPKRTHSLKTPESNNSGYVIRCSCRIHIIKTEKRAKRLCLFGGRCRACRSTLTFEGKNNSSEQIAKRVVVAPTSSAEKPIKAGKTFASTCRDIIKHNPNDSFETLVKLCVVWEANKSVSKTRSYLRHILVKELGRKI